MEYRNLQEEAEKREADACKVTVERYRQLVELYQAGKYQFKAPPVYTGNWGFSSWIRYIQLGGGRWIESTDQLKAESQT